MIRKNWKRLQPTGLRQALELCKEHAREKRNLSVERIAEEMGEADQWTLYKWIQTGRIPAIKIRAYENTCGIEYVTRWLAASAGKLLIDLPAGHDASAGDMQQLQALLNTAVGQLLKFYAGKIGAADALGPIQQAMEGLAWHRGNVERHAAPQFDFGKEKNEEDV